MSGIDKEVARFGVFNIIGAQGDPVFDQGGVME